MPESVLSRLARSTELSKTESHSAGAARIQSRRTRTRRIRLSSKLYKHTLRLKPCQPAHPTGFPNVFHIGKGTVERRHRRASLVTCTQPYGPPLGIKRRRISGARRSGRLEIEKRSYWRSLL